LIAAQYTLVTDQNTLKNLLTDQYSNWHDLDIQPTETITNAPLQCSICRTVGAKA
jgi:hypothetical protein